MCRSTTSIVNLVAIMAGRRDPTKRRSFPCLLLHCEPIAARKCFEPALRARSEPRKALIGANRILREICGNQSCSVVLSGADLQRAHLAKLLK
jgi:hypothetical protein